MSESKPLVLSYRLPNILTILFIVGIFVNCFFIRFMYFGLWALKIPSYLSDSKNEA